MDLTKYRICKNKYGWYKIQRYVFEEKTEKDITLLESFLHNISLAFYYPKHWHWRNTWDNSVYDKKENALNRIEELLADEEDRLKATDESWKCEDVIS